MLSKPVQIRRGYPVRIVATDMLGVRARIVGIISLPSAGLPDIHEEVGCWTANGDYVGPACHVGGGYDLINVSERLSLWLNVYRHADGYVVAKGFVDRIHTVVEARRNPGRVACIRFDLPPDWEGRYDE